jgi:hypothetical protein
MTQRTAECADQLSAHDFPYSYDFSFDWVVNRHGVVLERSPDGMRTLDVLASFDPDQHSAVRSLVERHNRDVQLLLAHIDELKYGPRKGWAFTSDTFPNEWSDSHPVNSGEHPDAQDVRPCTLRAFWSAK